MAQNSNDQHNDSRDEDPSPHVRISDVCHKIRKLLHDRSIFANRPLLRTDGSDKIELLPRGILVYSLTVVVFLNAKTARLEL